MKFSIIVFIFFALILIQSTNAQEPNWLAKIKQIIPVDSTEKDVEKLFGKPKERNKHFAEYETKYGDLIFEYSIGECKNPTYYKVPSGTVVGIDFSLRNEFNFSKLKLNLNLFIREDSEDTENLIYKSPELGITYSTYVKRQKNTEYEQRPKILTSIHIYPSTKYDHLQCLLK